MKHFNRMKHMIAGALAAMTLTTAAIPAFTLNAAAAETQTVSAADAFSAAFAEYIPDSDKLLPALETLNALDTLPADQVFAAQNNAQITALRNELRSRITAVNSRISYDVLNQLRDEKFPNGYGAGLDRMQSAFETMAKYIDTFANSRHYTEQTMIEIADALYPDHWFINRWSGLETLADYLGNYDIRNSSDAVYVDLLGRIREYSTLLKDQNDGSLSQALFDNLKNKYMFSGEVYDVIAPYMEKMMYHYLYAYTIAVQCLAAAKTVADYQETSLRKRLEEDDSYLRMFRNRHRTAEEAANETAEVKHMLLGADSADSAISGWCGFHYRRQFGRSVYINRGTCNIALDSHVTESSFQTAAYCWNRGDSSTVFSSTQRRLADVLGTSAITPEQIDGLHDYVSNTYPSLSFVDFLGKMGIETDSFAADAKKFFPTCSDCQLSERKIGDENIGSKRFTTYQKDLGFRTFNPRVSRNEYKQIAGSRSIYDILGATDQYGGHIDTSAVNVQTLYTQNVSIGLIGLIFSGENYNQYRHDSYDYILLTFRNSTNTQIPATAAEMI